MGDFKIKVENKTGEDGGTGRHVNVMLFQTVPDKLMVESYSTAWKVRDIQYPGSLGPVVLPEKVEFYVIDHPQGDPRETGPYQAKFGDILEVTQTDKASAPSVIKIGDNQPDGEIKVNNKAGNIQPLEMALFKNGSKIVSFKNVNPADSAYLAIKPVIYVANIEGIQQGEDFKAANQATKSTKFELFPVKPNVTIVIKALPTGQLEFAEAS